MTPTSSGLPPGALMGARREPYWILRLVLANGGRTLDSGAVTRRLLVGRAPTSHPLEAREVLAMEEMDRTRVAS